MTTQGIQLWKVPATGNYSFIVAGAGGAPSSGGGRGYIITATLNLTQGQVLKILVGQTGLSSYGNGGGGGTFVATSTDIPLIVSGGGGGGSLNNNSNWPIQPGQDASGIGGNDVAGADGTGDGGCGNFGGGGASFTYNTAYALSFINGGYGGRLPDTNCVSGGSGGFGGGGGGGNGGGGGGGVGGGKGGDNRSPYYGGNGGSSFCSVTPLSTSYNSASSNGYVTITAKLAPAYYTSSSGYMLYYTFNSTTADLKALNAINSTSVIRTYTELTACWNIVHDKDLDTNIYYGMPESSRTLYRFTLTKGGTSLTRSTITTYTGATTSVLGACYAPTCMGTTNGAFIIGGYAQAVIHVLEFDSSKNVSYTYTVPYTSEVYGTEVIPKQVSGFTQHFAVAYTRGSRQLSSYTVDMSTRTWGNRYDITYNAGSTGPSNGLGMLYYPPNKEIFTGDPHVSTNRIAMNDTSTTRLFVYTVTQNENFLTFTWLKTVDMQSPAGGYPYSLSQTAYDSLT
jgi:hypothetical protein